MRNHELIGTFRSEDYVFDNGGPDRRTIIGKVQLADRKTVTVRGYAADGVLVSGLSFRFYGHWTNHHKYGKQFAFSSCVQDEPADEETVIAYLMTCRVPERGSITRRVATALWERHGLQAIDKLIHDPLLAADGIAQWPAEKACKAAEYLRTQRGTQRVKMDLIQLLDGSGVPKKTVDRCVRKWGSEAANRIKADAYLLCDLPGIGFRLADKIWCDLARRNSSTPEELADKLEHIRRQEMAVRDAVARETRSTGSTWHPRGWAVAQVQQLVSATAARPAEAIRAACEAGFLRVTGNGIAIERAAANEDTVAQWIGGTAGQPVAWPDPETIAAQAPDGKPLSQHQQDAIRIATTETVGCLQGSPGVGKTFAVACIVRAVIEQHGRDAIAVAAPTGKAAVRVQQSMAANGVDLAASTIHRLLGVAEEGSDGSGWQFVHNEQNPLEQRFLIVDESSMIDTDLMAALLRACSAETHLLLVGDIHQLPPVGHGRPFMDLQECLPVGELTEIRRNSGRIVQACAEIRDSNRMTCSPNGWQADQNENLIALETADADLPESLVTLIERLAIECDDITEQVQVLCAKNDTRRQLNRVLQQMLNADGATVKGNPFRRGDKIVLLKNGTYPDAEEQTETHFVANGELGRVGHCQPGRMIVDLCDPQRSIIVTHAPVGKTENGIADNQDEQRGALGDWDLGYCLSVHRSQGSQWRFVLVCCEQSGQMVQSRQWIYTAISRAELATWVLGQQQTIQQGLRRNGIAGRVTMLPQLIGDDRALRTVDHAAIWSL